MDDHTTSTPQDTLLTPADDQSRLPQPLRLSFSRRRVMQISALGVLTTAAAGLLAACGGDDDDDDDASPTSGGGGGGAAPTNTAAAASTSGTGAEPTAAEEEETETSDDGEGEAGAPGGELIYGLSSDPPNLDPHLNTGAAADTVKITMYSRIVRFWIDGEIQPHLAESFEISDDGLTYTFPLREGIVWHDGSEFSGDDIAATLERIQDEELGATYRSQLSVITEVDTATAGSVTLTLSEPSAPLLTYLAHPNASVLQKAFLDGGGDPNTDVMGTGAFKFDSREPGAKLSVVKNPDYFIDGLPMLDKITFIPYADENTRMAAIRGGEIQMADYVPWKDMDALEDDSNYNLYTGDGSAFMTVYYNVRNPPFDNPQVRVALGYAIDRQSIIDIVFFGRGSGITGGLVPESNWAHAEDLDDTFSYDPDRAKELLAEAGFPDGFSVKLLSTSQYLMHQNTGEIVQANLRDIGIDCELELYDWPTTVDKGNRGEYEFRINGIGTGYGDPDFMSDFFHSASAYSASTGFEDAEIDRLLEEGRAITDQAERKPIYDELQARLLELSPFTFLTYRVQGEVTAANVKGYEHFPGGLFSISAESLEKVTVN